MQVLELRKEGRQSVELGAEDEGLQSRLLMDSELAQGLSHFAKGFVRPFKA